MIETSIELPALQLRADITSADPAARTVELVFSTGAPVTRFDWLSGSRYVETLGLAPGQMRTARLNAGAPFLNAHSAGDVGDVLGVVVPGSAAIKDGAAVATVRFSKRADVDPVWQDVADGILRNVSVGYQVHKYEHTEGREGALATRHAVDWEPFEISAVPMGADPGAQTRAADADVPRFPCVLVERAAPRKESRIMDSPSPTVAAELPVEKTPADLAREAETKRVRGILAATQAARLPVSFAEDLIGRNVSLEDAQGIVLDTLRHKAGDPTGPTAGPSRVPAAVVVGSDPLENVWRGIEGALLNRLDPRFTLDDNSRQYRASSVMRVAEECLEQRGIRTRGLAPLKIAELAFAVPSMGAIRAGFHTTSDFASILENVTNKILRQAYEEAVPTWRPFSRQIPIRDFKPVSALQLGEAPELKKILEHGEYTAGTIGESKETFVLATYGRTFGLTRQALINDDLSAFGRIPVSFAASARRKESDLVWAEILRNANMADGNALFSTAHANNTGTGTAIDVGSLGVGRAMIQKQKGLDGTSYINLDPVFLIVNPDKRTLAEQYTTQITPAQGSNVNPFSGRLQVISEARLSGGLLIDGEVIAGSATAWYLAVNPGSGGAVDVVLFGYLEGQDGPSVDSQLGWKIDGVEIRCRHDFVAHVVDYRGIYRNVGA